MQTPRHAKQWGTLFKRGIVLFCVFLLFVCVGCVLFLTSTLYARGTGQTRQSNNSVQPADTGTVIPTIVPTIVPTIAPTIVPTTAPTVQPTIVPTTAPTVQPTVPKPNPTTAPVPTATAIAGGLPPPSNNPPAQPTVGSVTSPTPTAQIKTTPDAGNPTAAATNTASAPITNTTTTATTTQPNVANTISMGQIAAIVGGVVILGGALFALLVWRQRRMQPRPIPRGLSQRTYPPQGRAVTEPLHQSPQPLVPQVAPALVASSQNASSIQYAHADTNRSMLREQGPVYQEASPAAMTMMQTEETPPHAATPPSARLLESMMRQAQMGLFALPDKTD